MKLTFDTVQKLSQQEAEPSWLLRQRKEAWDLFEKIPLPTIKEEEWKYTELRGFSFLDFELSSFDTAPLASLSSELKAKGVILCDLKTALKNHASLVLPLLQETKKEAHSKFEALHQALWHGGIFLYVPKGVVISEPIHGVTRLNAPNSVTFPFTLVLVEEQAKVSLIDEMISVGHSEGKQFSNGFRYLGVKEGAELQYVNIQTWGSEVSHFETQVTKIEKDAKFQNIHVGLGGGLTKSTIHTILSGTGAQASLLGVFFGNQKQHFDIFTTQDHRVRETQSDLLFKSALKDFAQSNYQGIIRIPKSAQRSDAYQANKNLLLSPNAKARSVPKLEIIADDVRCTHSATMGTIDENELFYLESRGLTPSEAQKTIVEGFFEQVVTRIPSEEIRERLRRCVAEKLSHPSSCEGS